MTDDITRLKKEVNDLKSRLNEIQMRIETRQMELNAALVKKMTEEYAAQGIVPGCKVVAVRDGWNGTQKRTLYGYAGVRVTSWGGAKPALIKIKQDGSVGKQPAGIIVFDRIELAQEQ